MAPLSNTDTATYLVWSTVRNFSETASSWKKRRGGGTAIQHAPPIAPASVPSVSNQNQFLSHSVDKMFEEAEISGILLLNGRKLKEFPSELASKFDISDVIFADLSENRFNDLPGCICKLSSMETLRIRYSGLRNIPSTINMLASLCYLDLSCNHLTSLPNELFTLPLQVLLLKGNLFETLPREIRHLADTLNELDVSCNRLRAIPSDIGLLKNLRVLNLRANRLTQLPSEVSRLGLRVFNVAENLLTELPFELLYMPSLVDFRVQENPFISPPVKVCLKGREHIFKWLRVKSTTLPDGNSKQSEWANRPVSVNVNATMRRSKQYNIYASAENDGYEVSKRVERRPRSTRFNTLGGSDSGYASTVDEHRHSNEYQLPVTSGSLFGINESLQSPPYDRDSPKSTGMLSSGDRTITPEGGSPIMEGSSGLLKEVMLAYAQKVAATTPDSTQERKSSAMVLSEPSDEIQSQTPQKPVTVSTVPVSNPSPVITSARPQAIVTPMSSKPITPPQTLSNAENTMMEAVRREELLENSDEIDLIKHARLMVIRKKTESFIESNNNVISESSNVTSKSEIAKAPRGSARINSPSTLLLNKESDEDVVTLPSAEIESFYVGARQRTPMRRRTETVDTAVTLSPVIEIPSTDSANVENGNVVQDFCACPATCVNPSPTSSVATTVCCSSSVESVSSTVKVPNTKATKGSTGGVTSTYYSRLNNANAPASRTGNVTTRGTALRKPIAPSHAVSRVAPTHTPASTLSTSRVTKLSKARDSIGVAKGHLSNNNNNNNYVMRSRPTSATFRMLNEESAMSTSTGTVSLAARRSIETMRKVLEGRLETKLPTENDALAACLTDGTALCDFANRIRSRVVPTILKPSSSQGPLSLPKCRRNVENFIAACRRIGVAEPFVGLVLFLRDRGLIVLLLTLGAIFAIIIGFIKKR